MPITRMSRTTHALAALALVALSAMSASAQQMGREMSEGKGKMALQGILWVE